LHNLSRNSDQSAEINKLDPFSVGGVDCAASMIDGRTVMGTGPDGKSAEGIIALWDYMEERPARIHQIPMLYETAQQVV
jgi:hypothetical protein